MFGKAREDRRGGRQYNTGPPLGEDDEQDV